MPCKSFSLRPTSDGYGRLQEVFLHHVSQLSVRHILSCFPSLFQLYINRKCNFSITLQVLLYQFGHFTVICQHRRTYSAKISPHSSCLAKGMQHDKHISGADPTEMNWASVALWKHWLPVVKYILTILTASRTSVITTGHLLSSGGDTWARKRYLSGAKLTATPFTSCTFTTAGG